MKAERTLTKGFVLRNIAGQLFLIPLKKSPQKLISLNSLAVDIWRYLGKGYSISWCVETISNQFRVSKEIVRKDIAHFLEEIKMGVTEELDINSLSKNLKSRRIPFQGSIELTGRCNLNCFHCYARGERGKKELSLQSVKKIFDQLVKNGCLFLQLTGGECLLRKDFKAIYLYIRRAGIIPTISTNATLFDNDLIRCLNEYPPYRVMVSLYGVEDFVHGGVTQTKGSFQKTLVNVIKLKKAGVNVWFTGVVFKENFSEVLRMKKLARKLDILIFFYPFLIPALNKDLTPLTHCLDDEKCAKVIALNKDVKFLKRPREIKRSKNEVFFPCNAGLQSFHIDAEGKLYLCKIERSVGFSLLGDSFENSWRELTRVRLAKLSLPASCLNCQYKLACEICPPMMRLYESSGLGKIFCQRVKIKQEKVIEKFDTLSLRI